MSSSAGGQRDTSWRGDPSSSSSAYLRSLLFKILRITIHDGRYFIGHLSCVDSSINIVLSQAEEFLPSPEDLRRRHPLPANASEETHAYPWPYDAPLVVGPAGGREMGMVMIKGQDVVKIEVEGMPEAADQSSGGSAPPPLPDRNGIL